MRDPGFDVTVPVCGALLSTILFIYRSIKFPLYVTVRLYHTLVDNSVLEVTTANVGVQTKILTVL
jgi:hypothetical protein